MSYQTKRFLYTVAEVGVWVGAMVLITDSAKRDRIADQARELMKRAQYEADVAETLSQIRSLPEE